MATKEIYNGPLTSFHLSGKSLSGSPSAFIQHLELVTAVEGGAKEDLAKKIDDPYAAGSFGIFGLGVRKDVAAPLASADGDITAAIFDALGRLHVNAGQVPAASRTTDSVAVTHSVDKLSKGNGTGGSPLVELTPTKVPIAANLSGANTLLAAQGVGNKILVHQVFLIAATAVTARFESGGGADLTGDLNIDAKQGFVTPFSPIGWFPETGANESLVLTLSSAVYCGGVFAYTVVT